jgi:hypothetical protein
MLCKNCTSGNIRTFQSELTVTCPEFESLSRTPVYICQATSICLDCGHTEIAIPAEELEQLKGEPEGMSPNDSPGDDSLSF